MRGDSLLGPDPSALSFNRVHIEKSGLERLKAEYLRSFDGFEKARLRDEIAAARKQVQADLGGAAVPEGVIDWRVEFAEVFAARGGFDIAIANPPYERQEQISGSKRDLKLLYPDVYTGTADYYVYFYNRAVQSLRDGGLLAFISSNKYMRAGYGKKLRAYLSSSLTLSEVVDFGDLPVFTATAYPSVIVGRKLSADADLPLRVADLVMPIRRDVMSKGLPVTTEAVNRSLDGLPTLLDWHAVSDYPRSMLGEDGWVLEDIALVRLFERLMNTGTPLGEFVEGRIYYGIKTGLNEAFVIDQSKRDQLVAADPSSADMIKPWLRGRDIKRWRADWGEQYVIAIQNSGDASANNPWAARESEESARAVFRGHYPALHEHLSQFEEGLRKRSDQGRFWWELRACAYYPEFDHPKIIFGHFINGATFAFDPSGSITTTPVPLPYRQHHP